MTLWSCGLFSEYGFQKAYYNTIGKPAINKAVNRKLYKEKVIKLICKHDRVLQFKSHNKTTKKCLT